MFMHGKAGVADTLPCCGCQARAPPSVSSTSWHMTGKTIPILQETHVEHVEVLHKKVSAHPKWGEEERYVGSRARKF